MPITQSQVNPQMMGADIKADIIFIIDSSGSMLPCFDGVKKHIQVFVQELTTGANTPIDYRLGILSAGYFSFLKKDFTENIEDFRTAIGRMKAEWGNEFTLPALDFAMDYDFRQQTHKVIILFSDEPVRGGAQVKFQLSKLDELIEKATMIHVKFFIFAPDCPSLKQIANLVPGSSFTDIRRHEEFFTSNFSEVLKKIGKTVSSSCGSFVPDQLDETDLVEKDLYRLKKRLKPEIIEV